MTPRRILPAALAAALLIPAAAAEAKAPSCTRGGATLEEASGNVRVVRRALKTNGVNETRRDGLSACWAPTGKRFRIATERDFGDDLRSSTRVEIVDERYAGVVLTGEGGVSIGVTAAQLEPAAAGARSLARAYGSDSFIDRLYWTLGDGTINSRVLG